MKKILAFFLAALMVMSFAACTNTENNPTDAPTEVPTEAPTDAPTEAPTDAAPVEEGISFFMLSINHADGTPQYLMALPNEDGTVYLDMVDTVTKKGSVDGTALADIDTALQSSGLLELESTAADLYTENNVSLSVSYYDGDGVELAIHGDRPEAFDTGYAAMVACFTELMADLPVYVAKPMENGEIADSDRAALDGILANLELSGPADSYTISGIARDEFFANALGLVTDEGIASGVQFAPMMTTSAYALSIVTLEEGADANTIADSFEKGVDWTKWICVMPERAYIATKDNQVLCLLGSLEFFDATVAAIEADGWTAYKTLVNADFVA